MILVGQFDSPFVRRVAVTLNHYHMPYTRNPISVFRDVSEVQKINPLVRVPSLILETGEVLIDSSAIIDHLDEMAGPARALLPPETRDGMTWKAWTEAVKAATGRKGKPLFMPLRLALTGLDHGPELAQLLPLIGRETAVVRLS